MLLLSALQTNADSALSYGVNICAGGVEGRGRGVGKVGEDLRGGQEGAGHGRG